MPEVILPCPACGGDVKISGGDEWHNQHSFFIQCQCGVCRVGDTVRAECIDRWNALPRALRWTHEPPKVAGWYWCRLSRLNMPRCVEVYISEDGLRFGSGDNWREPSMSVEFEGFEWAGPIAPPIEP